MAQTQENRIGNLERRMSAQDTINDKFDIALDKISEVSLNVSKLLAVQEQRLEAQEEASKALPMLLENRRLETSQHIENLHGRITSSELELRKDMNNGQKEILSEIKSLRTDLTKQTETVKIDLQENFDEKIDRVDNRVSKLERFVYIAIGGASVVTFIVSETISWFGGHGK